MFFGSRSFAVCMWICGCAEMYWIPDSLTRLAALWQDCNATNSLHTLFQWQWKTQIQTQKQIQIQIGRIVMRPIHWQLYGRVVMNPNHFPVGFQVKLSHDVFTYHSLMWTSSLINSPININIISLKFELPSCDQDHRSILLSISWDISIKFEVPSCDHWL